MKHDTYRGAPRTPGEADSGGGKGPDSKGFLSPVTVLPQAIQNLAKVEYILS